MVTKTFPRTDRTDADPRPVLTEHQSVALEDLIDGIRRRAVVTEYALQAPDLSGVINALAELASETEEACDLLESLLWPDGVGKPRQVRTKGGRQ